MQGVIKTGSDLPEVLVFEILSKLPVKSLSRFKCVSKTWSSSFQTPLFISEHLNNNLRNNDLNLLLNRCHGNTHYLSQLSTEKGQSFSVKQNVRVPFFENSRFAPAVRGPCNGILCLHDHDKAALWNPSTREFKTLPQSSVQRPPSADPARYVCFGFGYDSQTDDFKVVRFVSYFVQERDDVRLVAYWKYQVELYSLKSDIWKEISAPAGHPFPFTSFFHNSVNGFYFWQTYRDSEYLILSFDMVDEKFSTLPFPQFGETLQQFYWQLLNFNGLLGAIFYPREGTERSFDLWVMNGSWTKQFTIDSVPGVERPLGFWKNGELFLESSDDELVLFDPSTRELRNLGIHAYEGTIQIIGYVESLVPINGRSEHEERIIRRPAGGGSS